MSKTLRQKLTIKFEELTVPQELNDKLSNVQTPDKLYEVDALIDDSESYEEFLRRAYEILA